jgi:hypothetical protein
MKVANVRKWSRTVRARFIFKCCRRLAVDVFPSPFAPVILKGEIYIDRRTVRIKDDEKN